jgi:hypothetical protein
MEVSKIDKAALLGVAVPEALGGVSNPDFLMMGMTKLNLYCAILGLINFRNKSYDWQGING